MLLAGGQYMPELSKILFAVENPTLIDEGVMKNQHELTQYNKNGEREL